MNIIRIPFYALLTFGLLVGCGKKDEKKKEGFTKENVNTQEKTDSNKADDNVANIVLTGNDVMQFNQKEIRVKAGQKVKLTLRHIGKLDVNIMGHNFVLLKKGTDLIDFATKAGSERDNEYLPKDSQDIIAHTDMIGGGQVTTIEFDAPEKGTYEFLCSFPGHYGMMRGQFIVE
tara:strand:+ start:438 stop:959 length:522 start_codon:yes stop_codon:yes gene_type:complete